MNTRLAQLGLLLALTVGLVRAAEPPPAGSVGNDREKTMGRYNLGRSLAQQGKYPEAFAEFVWCFDVGMKKDPVLQGARTSYLLKDLRVLAEPYPPALEMLMARRDAAKVLLVEGKAQPSDAADFVYLNQALDRTGYTLTIYDKVPEGPARQTLASFLLEEFLKRKRYKDAAYAEPYAKMLEELATQVTKPDPKAKLEQRQMEHAYQVKWFSTCLEILAGSGQLKEAKEMLGKALTCDNSPAAKDEYRRSLKQAGQPTLLP